ncbi:MAG: sugar ABC transporter substrate-binding protein [Chloroflexi bacterium]|nr:sugar ABC transporter substrate-binding protein [Chloroflexota bacterium]
MYKPTQSILLLLAALCLLAAGCAGPRSAQQTPTPSAPAPAQVALVMKTLTNPFFVEMEKGARQAEQELGVHLIVKTAAQETSIEQQIEIVEELIQNRVDAIVIAPGDSTSLIPVLQKAQEAGIVIINIDNRLNGFSMAEAGLEDVPFISVDNEQGAYLSAGVLTGRVEAPVEAVILEGIPTANNAIDRKRGALHAFGENPNVTLVASASAHWKIDEAHDLIGELYEDHPQIGLIYCANDMMALGVLKYLEETGRRGVGVAGFDALPEAMPAIRSGELLATVDQQAARQGYLGVQYAVKRLAGESTPAVTLVDAVLVTRQTVNP